MEQIQTGTKDKDSASRTGAEIPLLLTYLVYLVFLLSTSLIFILSLLKRRVGYGSRPNYRINEFLFK
jgi:hypothetical protein